MSSFYKEQNITNDYGPDSKSTLEGKNLRAIPSIRRNPILADIFSRLNYMERRGSGFKKILDAYSSYDQKPVFLSEHWGFTITFPNVNYDSGESGLKIDLKLEKWPEKCQQIYDAIKLDSNITIAKLESLLDTGHTTVKKMLAEMQNEGFIRHIGPDKGGHWEITGGDIDYD